jgi:hypothetical protein
MEYRNVEFKLNPDDSTGQFCCPVCNAVWIDVQAGKPALKHGACKHFMFIWEPCTEAPTCFNGLTSRRLVEAISSRFRSLNPKGIWEDAEDGEIMEEIHYDQEFWEGLSLDEVDTILDHTECAGPSSHTALFGMKTSESSSL